MPAALEEIIEAEEEGITMHPGLGPKRILGVDGKVTALETLKTKWVFDQNKRFNPAFYENSESQIRVRHDHHGDRSGAASRFLYTRRQGGTVAARPDRGESTNSDDLGGGNFRRGRLRLRTSPHYR